MLAKEPLKNCQEESAKSSAFGVRRSQSFLLHQVGEEILDVVLGLVGGMSPPAAVGVKRVPVSAIQRSERCIGCRRRTAAGPENDAPIRGRKNLAAVRERPDTRLSRGHHASFYTLRLPVGSNSRALRPFSGATERSISRLLVLSK